MTDLSLVDPELRPALEAMPAFALSHEALPMVREGMNAMLTNLPLPEGAPVGEERRVPGPAGAPEVRVLVYRPVTEPGDAPVPAMLHIHGGGYVMGSVGMMAPLNAITARDHRCVVVSVDYRLAPETVHPGPVEDCYAALRWLHAEAESLGVDPDRIGISGESAGGGLAAATALLARDRGEIKLAFQQLIYPMLDDRTCTRENAHPHVGHHIWDRVSNIFGWSALLGRAPGGEGVEPYAAPARAESLAGLPPTYIDVGALDLFLEEDLDYALRLTRAGVPVELHVYPGAYHGFEMTPGSRLAETAQLNRQLALVRFFSA